MRILICGLIVSLFPILSLAEAANVILFQESFDGPVLDLAKWRTEIVTSGPRWCDTDPGSWCGPGVWVEEGSACYGVAAQAPYGSAPCSEGMLHVSSSNGRACPYLASRLPGSVELFPPAGDFTLKVRMRYDRITPWGDGLMVVQTQSTEPTGDNAPAPYENLVFGIWADLSDIGSLGVVTGLNGYYQTVTLVPSPNALHEFMLECVGTTFTFSVDGGVVYGPVESALRPTAIWMGNPTLAYWYPTDWTSFSVDDISVEVPGPTSVRRDSWGGLKALYR